MNAHPHMAAFSLIPTTEIPLKDRLIVALDVESVGRAEDIVDVLGDAVSFYKIGLQLQYADPDNSNTISFVRDLISRNKKVFLDSKIFDIANTIEKTVSSIARMNVDFLTVHGDRKVVEAAVRVPRDKLKIFAVTFLTTLDQQDLLDMNLDISVDDFVVRRAQIAIDAGADGVIASGLEAAQIKNLALNRNKPELRVVTPGVRPSGSPANDQRRVATPYDSIAAGADYLVVGRPVLNAPDKLAAVRAISAEIERGLAHRAAFASGRAK